MAGMSGHGLQAELKRIAPDLPVIIITAFGSIQTAVESMKLGAFDYITKPFSNSELLLVVSRALENRDLRMKSNGCGSNSRAITGWKISSPQVRT